ncbi:hypothetical protein GQ43DRAFT_413143 [Delitschia confertaspora ATCC 74209]|uniref:G-protein coupled receptors family 2 profile 2 domain-containing protein n=1 Tax=Delitschia confertaspora ATCC 74209 TaxID=1513339 RepID=A0A9P4MTM5_9PLEO|nr:hypothetical protein GQ43DRAFT_413143 [Delitschia confertaspora ATCC 74209]
MSMDFFAREVLSAPHRLHEIRVLNEVIVAVSILSILGAGWIMLSFCLFKQVRTFRHQLILGLAISDFLMASNFLSSSAVNLSGHLISDPPQKKFCSFNGFMAQVFVIQTDYWVLMIAICTFFILASYKRQSTWIQKHRIILWSIPWGFSVLWATLGIALTGYGGIGAWCWFTSDRVRLLVNFLPRWLIIIAILALYVHLYRIIYKAHNGFMTFDQDGILPHSIDPELESVSSTRRIGRPSSNMILSSPKLKKMAYQMMSYPLVYMLIWTIPTSIRIYQSVTGKPAPFGIATVDKACIVIQGFADAIIYGVNETSLHVWRERFSSNPPTERVHAPQNIRIHIRREVNVSVHGEEDVRDNTFR